MFIIIPIFFVGVSLIFNCNISFSNIYCNLLLAEITTNIYSFIIIVPNHSGEDVYRFSTHVAPKSGEFYLRQIISSVNYNAGNDFIDFLHGWLNYQIEHHLFPNISHIHYPEISKLVKKKTKEYDLPYNCKRNFLSAVSSHAKMLYSLGKK